MTFIAVLLIFIITITSIVLAIHGFILVFGTDFEHPKRDKRLASAILITLCSVDIASAMVLYLVTRMQQLM